MYNGSGAGYEQYDQPQANTSRVKVEDALSYLDQVKTQFQAETQVYTQFLDIMKDFKSQAIDTPGVITRVSGLFHGKPQLILGFNQFLPQGFEVSIEGNQITILEPSGTRRYQRIENGQVIDVPAVEKGEKEEPPEEQPVLDEGLEPEADSGEDEASSIGQEDGSFTDVGQDHQGNQLNTAIGYVNKIKARFANRPYVYKKFLDILQEYQRSLGDKSVSQSVTERAILDAVENLFGEETDLLEDFRYFLPDVHGLHQRPPAVKMTAEEPESDQEEDEAEPEEADEGEVEGEDEEEGETMEDGSAESSGEDDEEGDYDPKDYPLHRQISDLEGFVSAVKIEDLSFFERIRRTLTDEEQDCFFRMLHLYNINVITGQELLTMLKPVLGGYPDFLQELDKRFLSRDNAASSSAIDNLPPEEQHQIDYPSCKQMGVSYRCLPETVQPPICSGRTELCRSVLNDTWVSFPSWSSEDTTVVSSKKTQYEDFVCRTEDERFELDIIIEVNKYAVDSLEFVKRKMARMSTLEQEKFKLDEKLGATSSVLMSRAIRRIYGEHAGKVIDGLRKNPAITVPKVIDRLKDKEREWREAQEAMNKIWREQNDKHMIRALDHQSNALKTSDAKWIKAKQIVTQMEQLFDERQQRSEEGICEDSGPHMILSYPMDKAIIHEATDLIIHYVKRQANINNEEKKKIKRLLRKYVSEWFFLPHEPMSDDEDNCVNGQRHGDEMEDYKEPVHIMGTARSRLLYGGNPLLVFLRVHQILCDRLGKVKKRYLEMVDEYNFDEDIARRRAELYKEHGKGAASHEMNASDMHNGLPELKGARRCPMTFYVDLVSDIKAFLDGHLEGMTFEDNVRGMFPLDGYLLFSVDKIISVCTRQLQQLATNSDNSDTIKLYDKYKVNPPFSIYDDSDRRTGIEGEYSSVAEAKMNCQNCFKVYLIDEEKVKVTLELVDTETGDGDTDNGEIIERAASAAATTDDDELDEDTPLRRGLLRRRLKRLRQEENAISGVFLRRNARFRKRDPGTADRFLCLKGTYSTAKEKERLCHLSHEGLIRKRRIGVFQSHQNLARMHEIRRRRFARVFNEEDDELTWLDNGAEKITVHNPEFPYLIYNRYLLNKADR